jgi:hypothetical protein
MPSARAPLGARDGTIQGRGNEVAAKSLVDCLDSYIDHQAGRLKTRGTGQRRDAGKAATSTVAVATPACNPLSGLGQVALPRA